MDGKDITRPEEAGKCREAAPTASSAAGSSQDATTAGVLKGESEGDEDWSGFQRVRPHSTASLRITSPICLRPVEAAQADPAVWNHDYDGLSEGTMSNPDRTANADWLATSEERALQDPTSTSPLEIENEEHVTSTEDEGSGQNDGDDDEDDSEDEDDEPDEGKTCKHAPRPKPKKPMASLLALAERAILKQLTKAVDGQRVTARYCCGGRVRSLHPAMATIFQDEKPRKVPRLTMRWDDPEDRRGRKIHFPYNDSQSFSKFDGQVETLADRCEATGILDDSRFSINFDPHFYGIIDVITQVLVPGFESEILKNVPEHRGVRAKLSNLQVRSAGGTAYRPLPAHRSTQYFGKLIVCLPYAHKGGQWEISSDGHSTTFDFGSSDDTTTVHWAAWVGDCTHECQPVEESHQLVLTYNLFLCQRTGEVLRDNPTADPALFPLYAGVKEMLEHPGFMKKGGILGFYCQYPYLHVSSNATKQLPSILQGVDMVVYSVFKSLGLRTDILPILDLSPLDEMDEIEYEHEEECYHEDPWYYRSVHGDEYDDDQIAVCDCCYPDFPSFEEWKAMRPRIDRIGTKLHGLKFSESGEEAEWSREEKESRLEEEWSWREYKDIRWLNEPEKPPEVRTPLGNLKGWEVAIVNTASFDHEESTETFYSHPVILIKVPKLVDRELTVGKLGR